MGKVVKINEVKKKKGKGKEENKRKHFVIQPDSLHHKTSTR